MWLLEWLVARWQSVTDWFGDNYWTVRNMLSGLPDLINAILSAIVVYFNYALNTAIQYVNDFYTNYIAPFMAAINSIANDARNWAITAYNYVNNFISYIEQQLTNLWYDLVAYIRSTYDGIINAIVADIDYLRNDLIPNLISQVNIFSQYIPWLENAALNLAIDEIKEMLSIYVMYKKLLIALLDNPTGFILNLLWPKFINFLCYLVGYALGSTKYELPDIPDWNKE